MVLYDDEPVDPPAISTAAENANRSATAIKITPPDATDEAVDPGDTKSEEPPLAQKSRRRQPRRGRHRRGKSSIHTSWIQYVDESSGYAYYYNAMTAETSWSGLCEPVGTFWTIPIQSDIQY